MATKHRGFTLVELMITVSIIGLMAGMILFAFYSAQETAREAKTRSIIVKLDSILRLKWDSYATRRVPVVIAGMNPRQAAKARLDGLRDLMRMELPDRWTDITGPPTAIAVRPAVNQVFLRRFNTMTPSTNFQNAECLYLVACNLAAEDDIDIDALPTGDVDNDGYREFLDGWGQPIRWLRWAPGFQSTLQTILKLQTGSASGGGGQAVTITTDGTNLSITPGAYVGGTIAAIDATTGVINTDQTARITEYSNSGGTASFICSVPGSGQKPFGGSTPSAPFIVTAPDQFDQAGVYPIYNQITNAKPTPADTSVPSFSLYPLVYSAGPNKCFGISSDFTPPLDYTQNTVALNPFYCPSGSQYIGTPLDLPAEQNFVKSGWLDNITSHSIAPR